MASSTLFFCTDHINTPTKKGIKALIFNPRDSSVGLVNPSQVQVALNFSQSGNPEPNLQYTPLQAC